VRRFFLVALLLANANYARPLGVGETAPEFELPSLLPDTKDLTISKTTGVITYLDFWASWCGPCNISFPEMIELKEEFKNQPVEVIAISVDKKRELARRFLGRHRINFKVAIDATGNTAEAFDVPGMPTSFIIDSKGKVYSEHEGFRKGDMKKIREQIKTLLIADQT